MYMSNAHTFATKRGELTEYALGCGYIQRREVNEILVTLWREHGVYHVRVHDFRNGWRVAWETFKTLTDARKYYRCWDPAN